MFLTIDELKKAGAPCKEGQMWFNRWFPNGGELSEVIQHKYINTEFLHWGYTHLIVSDKERELYWDKVGVDKESRGTCYISSNVINSHYVSRANNVENSEYVFVSESVYDSEVVFGCTNVENSGEIYDSEFIEDCRRVNNSRNVVRSNNIAASTFVVDSNSIINSSIITNSSYVGGLSSARVSDSAFIDNCEDIDHCLFCTGIKDKKYLLFNKPIDPKQFELIRKQMTRILDNWSTCLVYEWPEATVNIEKPRLIRNAEKQYQNLPDTFWRWVKTLPGYDPEILYAITYSKELI